VDLILTGLLIAVVLGYYFWKVEAQPRLHRSQFQPVSDQEFVDGVQSAGPKIPAEFILMIATELRRETGMGARISPLSKISEMEPGFERINGNEWLSEIGEAIEKGGGDISVIENGALGEIIVELWESTGGDFSFRV
jgi:hypothetical protein